MKKILLLCSFLLIHLVGNTQTILHDTVVYNSFPKDNMPYILYDTIWNNTTSIDTIYWNKSSEQILSGWVAIGLCDPISCYSAADSLIHMYELAPGDYAEFSVGMKAAPSSLNGASYVTLHTNYGDMVYKFETAPSLCNANFYIYEDTLAAPHTYLGVNTCTGSIATYDWNWGDGSSNSSGPYPSHTYSTAGIYTICLTVTDGTSCIDSFCSSQLINKNLSDMLSVTFLAPTSTAAIEESSTTLYPNPAIDFLILKQNVNSNFQVEIYSINGAKMMHTSTIGGGKIDIRSLQQGLYFARVTDCNGHSDYMIFTKQ